MRPTAGHALSPSNCGGVRVIYPSTNILFSSPTPDGTESNSYCQIDVTLALDYNNSVTFPWSETMESAKITYRKQEWQVASGMTVRAAIEKIGLDPYGVLALRDSRLINDQTILQPGDDIRLVNEIGRAHV